MAVISFPAKIGFRNISELPRPGNPFITYVEFNNSNMSTGNEFIWSDVLNDYVAVGIDDVIIQGTWDADANSPDYTTTLTTDKRALVVVKRGTTNVNGFNVWEVGDLLIRRNGVYFRQPMGAQSLEGIEENRIVMKQNGALVSSSFLEGTNMFSDKTIQTPPASLNIGTAVKLSEVGGFVTNISAYQNRRYFLLDYELLAGGTDDPRYFRRGARQDDVIIQSDDTQTMTGVTSFTITPVAPTGMTPTPIEEDIDGITFDFVNALTNVSARIISVDSGNVVRYFPSLRDWENNTGFTVPSGKQKISFIDSPISINFGSQFTIEVKATQSVDLRGNGTLPYYSVDRRLVFNVLMMTAENVVTELESKTGDDRLDATKLKNLPTTRTDEDIRDVIGTTLTAGTNVTIVPDDANDTVTINATTIPARTDEDIRDVVGTTLVAGNGITITVDDANNTITISSSTHPPVNNTTPLYIAFTSDQLASSVNTATAYQSTTLSGTHTLPTFTGNMYLQILQPQTRAEYTAITLGSIDQKDAFTINTSAREISGTQYRQYVSQNLLISSVLSGEQITFSGGA